MQMPGQKNVIFASMTDSTVNVAFTGHRTYRGEGAGVLRETLEVLYARGFRTFLSGMAVGFDLAAAEAVLALRARRPEVRLVAVVPFAGQAERFPAGERVRFLRVVAAADECIVLSAEYYRGCYGVRNDFLVERAAVVVAWYDGSTGGTRYTVRRACACGREVIHLHPGLARQGELF